MQFETVLITDIRAKDPNGLEVTFQVPWQTQGVLSGESMAAYIQAVRAFSDKLVAAGYTPMPVRSGGRSSGGRQRDKLILHHPTNTLRVYTRYLPNNDPWKDIREALKDQKGIVGTLIVFRDGKIKERDGSLSDPPPNFPSDIPKTNHWILPVSALEFIKANFKDWYEAAEVVEVGHSDKDAVADDKPSPAVGYEVNQPAFINYAHGKAKQEDVRLTDADILYFLKTILPKKPEIQDAEGVKALFVSWLATVKEAKDA